MQRTARLLGVLLVVGVPASVACADDADVAAAAAAVQDAHASGETDRMTALLRDEPDPWFVVHHLTERAHYEAARAFADGLAPRSPNYTALPTYVASRRGREPEPEIDAARRAVEAALANGRFADALAHAPRAVEPLDSVGRLRLEAARARGLYALDRVAEAEGAIDRIAASARRMGWPAFAARAQYAAGILLEATGHADQALPRLEDALTAARTLAADGTALEIVAVRARILREATRAEEARAELERGRPWLGAGPADAEWWLERARLETASGRVDAAREAFAVAAKAARRLDRAQLLPTILREHAEIERAAGRWDAAVELLRTARTAHARLDDARGVADVDLVLSVIDLDRGRLAQARERARLAEAAYRRLGDVDGAMLALGNASNAAMELSLLDEAEAGFRTIAAHFEEIGAVEDAAKALNALGVVKRYRGDLPAALAAYERAAAIQREHGLRIGLAFALNNIGGIQQMLGAYEAAAARFAEALALLGDDARASRLRFARNLALAELLMGRVDQARARSAEVLEEARRVGASSTALAALHVLAKAQAASGNHEAAVQAFEEILQGDGDPFMRLVALASQGTSLRRLGRDAAAARVTRDALALAEEVDNGPFQAAMHERLARVLPDLGATVRHARRAVEIDARMRVGWDDLTALDVRAERSGVLALGLNAAQLLGDMESMFFFMEHDRASALVEALEARDGRVHDVLPASMRDRLRQREAAVRRTLSQYREATRSGSRRERVEARKRWRNAGAAYDAALFEVQRAERTASLGVAPTPATIADVQDHLEPGEALVLYHVDRGPAIALVITHDEIRNGQIGFAALLLPMVKRLLSADRKVLDERSVKSLGGWLIRSLHLEDVERLYVSPSAGVAYLPFTLLAPDQEIVVIPSATVFVRLAEQRSDRGVGILGLGAPDYRYVPHESDETRTRDAFRDRLLPLPESGPEVEAVADVALLGRAASEAGLREAIATRPRWRAVHFACHGILDGDDPRRSALALTADEDDDGLFTVGEVMRTRVPADLVVLSACDTARGTVYEAEGIVGLARAFMIAGAPRVLCSLWKVDDAATRALMERFYALWNPTDGSAGLPAVAALAAAQAHVRAQPGWEAPYYWAAWVLWGLP